MSTTRYNDVELSIVDANGNKDVLRFTNKGSNVSIDPSKNKMGKNNTSVIPAGVTNTQNLVNNLGSGAFKTFEITNSANIVDPGYVADARLIKTAFDKIDYLMENGVGTGGGSGVIGISDTIVTFPASGWVRDMDAGWTNTLNVGSTVVNSISDHFTYGLTTATSGAPSDEEWEAYSHVTDVACDRDNFTIIATAPDEAPAVDICIVIKGQGGYYQNNTASGDSVVLFNAEEWVWSESAQHYINTVNAGTDVTDKIDSNFTFGLTTSDGEASPSKQEWEAYACITDMAVNKDSGLIIASAKTLPITSIYIVLKNSGNVIGGSSGSSNAAGAAYANLEVTLYASEWEDSSDDRYAYMNTVYDSKLTYEMNPACSLAYGTSHEYDEYEVAWSKVKMIVTNNGSITFFANEIPAIDFDVVIHSIVTASKNTDQIEDVIGRMEDAEGNIEQLARVMSVMGTVVDVKSDSWTLIDDENSPYDGMYKNSVAVANITSDFHPMVFVTGKESAGGIPTDLEKEAFDTMVGVYTENGTIVFVSPIELTTSINVLIK